MKRLDERKTAFLLMCGLVCLWGLDYVFAKDALAVMDSMTLLFMKYSAGLLLMLGIKLKTEGKKLIRLKDLPLFILCAIAGQIFYFYCEYTAMDYMPVSLITIILAFVPAVSIATERLFYNRRPTKKLVFGVLLCVFGVAVVIGADFRVLLQGRIIGYLLAFGAVLSWNTYNFLTVKINKRCSEITTSFMQLACSVVLIMPFALYQMPSVEVFTPKIIIEVIYLGVGSAGIGFIITVRGLRVLGPTISAMFSNFLPVTTTFFGWIFLGEVIKPIQFIGGAIVIASSCIVIREKGKVDRGARDDEKDNKNSGNHKEAGDSSDELKDYSE